MGNKSSVSSLEKGIFTINKAITGILFAGVFCLAACSAGDKDSVNTTNITTDDISSEETVSNAEHDSISNVDESKENTSKAADGDNNENKDENVAEAEGNNKVSENNFFECHESVKNSDWDVPVFQFYDVDILCEDLTVQKVVDILNSSSEGLECAFGGDDNLDDYCTYSNPQLYVFNSMGDCIVKMKCQAPMNFKSDLVRMKDLSISLVTVYSNPSIKDCIYFPNGVHQGEDEYNILLRQLNI